MVIVTPKEAFEECLIKKERIIDLEKIISKDPYWSNLYARDIINGPFELGEKTISKDSYYSYRYASDVINGAFEKCHPVIFNSAWKYNYMKLLKSINYDMTKISEWLL